MEALDPDPARRAVDVDLEEALLGERFFILLSGSSSHVR